MPTDVLFSFPLIYYRRVNNKVLYSIYVGNSNSEPNSYEGIVENN